MARIPPLHPIRYTVPQDTLILHTEEGAVWHVQCARFAVQLAGRWDEDLEARWAAALREHRAEVEATRPWLAPGWLEPFLEHVAPCIKPIVDGIVSEWLFVSDGDHIRAAARLGRPAFDRCVALGVIPPDISFETALGPERRQPQYLLMDVGDAFQQPDAERERQAYRERVNADFQRVVDQEFYGAEGTSDRVRGKR